MTDKPIPKKNEALIALRAATEVCLVCGRPYTEVNANSHKTSPDPESVRFYFQFLHDDGEECIDQVMAVDFHDWMNEKIG